MGASRFRKVWLTNKMDVRRNGSYDRSINLLLDVVTDRTQPGGDNRLQKIRK
jgi:hypothetical protein